MSNEQHFFFKYIETTLTIPCDNLIRRDEYADHYSLFHNFLIPHADLIEFRCPMAPYGCKFFERRGEFRFGKNESHRFLNVKHPVADLINSDISGSLVFNLDSMYSHSSNASSKGKKINLLDLPFDVLFDIIDRLDSLSLYCLSMASKVSCYLMNLVSDV